MKKMLLLGAALMALSFVPANAAPGNGCSASGGALDAVTSCTYTASGPGTYVAATPNTWDITVPDRNNDGEPEVLASGELAPPSSGSIASLPGEVVTVTLRVDCVPPADVPCGSIGTLTVGETA